MSKHIRLVFPDEIQQRKPAPDARSGRERAVVGVMERVPGE